MKTMYQRPKAGESEEDLLKLQEEFFKDKAAKKIKPAATAVSTYTRPAEVNEEKPIEEIQEHLDNTFEDIPKNAKVGDIVERAANERPVSKFKFNRNAGFPQAKRRDPTVSAAGGSIFAQQMKKFKKQDAAPMEVDVINPATLQIKERTQGGSANVPSTSFIISGNEREEIHKENIDIMSKMTEEEILEERERLMSTLDPAIVAFLKSKRHHTKRVEETRQPSIAEQNRVVEEIKLEELGSTQEILQQPEADKWLNFDVLETNKLAWIKDVDPPKISKESQYEARFDFGGWLLPYTDTGISEKNRTLYHHGEEPERPGYTLQELFQLCRSSVNQQKIVALDTVANILSLHASGIYDKVIDIPIEQIFFVLRFSLDENAPAVLKSSIRAIRNLFYHPIDETCLDNLLGFGLGYTQPILAADDSEADDKTVNDQQLAETNLVKCLIRTDILTRIRYILNTVKPSVETVVYALEILIRMIRDSRFVMLQVYKCDGLLESIVTNFVPRVYQQCNSTSAYGSPMIHAIKFLRILSARSKSISIELINKYKILDSLVTYLSNEFVSANVNGVKLQIEAMHLWATLIRYGLGLDYFRLLQPVLLRLLDFHLRNSDVSASTSYNVQAHAAGLLNLLAEVAGKDYASTLEYRQLLVVGISKWLRQFHALEECSCGRLQLISGVFKILTNFIKHQPDNLNFPTSEVCKLVEDLLRSSGWRRIADCLRTGSNILNNYETHKCSANFKYTEAAIWNAADHVVPVLKTRSCMPFVRVVADFIETAQNRELILAFLSNRQITNYLAEVHKAKQYYLTSNWYTRIESGLLLSILKMAIGARTNIDTGMYYEVAVKTLSVYHEEQKADVEFVLKEAIFTPQFYPTEVFLSGLNLDHDTRNDTLRSCLEQIDAIFQVYMRVLGLRNLKVDFATNQSVDVDLGNVLPIDWIYSPIIVLYSNQQQEKNNTINEDEQVFTITNCLRWVYIYETYFPGLAKMIDTTDRFCRLACTFLGSDSLFLIPDVKNLLQLCLKSVLDNGSQLNFERTIHGLNNFQDFYTQLLEQYQGVSYGDALFGNFILIPLAQKHNLKYRKTLWSEYAGVVQIFNLAEKDILLPIDAFLEPEETDMSLLKCYRRAVVSGMMRRHSVFYRIAQHHVERFIAKRNSNK